MNWYYGYYVFLSDHPLPSVILQDKMTTALYSWKLNTAQERYTTTKNILLVYHQPIIVFKDHKNNTFNGLKASDRVVLLCWFLLLEEYRVKFENLPGKNNLSTVADTSFCLGIDRLKIQEEEVLTLLSGSENISISNIKWIIPMHTALIFKEQATVKEPGLREKGSDQPHYKQNLFSPINETSSREFCPGTMNIYFIQDRLELKRLSGIPWHGLVLHKILNKEGA
jgi:hypothetical protein